MFKEEFKIRYLAFVDGAMRDREKVVVKKLDKWSKEWWFSMLGPVGGILMLIGFVTALIMACFSTLFSSWYFAIPISIVIIGFILFIVVCADYTDYNILEKKYCGDELLECWELTEAAQQEYNAWRENCDNNLREKARRIMEEQDSEALFDILKILEGKKR